MKARLPLLVMLGGSLTFLASLFLTWDRLTAVNSVAPANRGAKDLLDLLSQSGFDRSYSGWASAFGEVGALCAVALCAAAMAALARRGLAAGVPVVRCGLALFLLAVLAFADLRARSLETVGFRHFATELDAAAYVGLASASVAFLAAAVLRRNELSRPSPEATLAACLTGGILTAFLIPLINFHPPHFGPTALGYQYVESSSYAEIVTVLVACWAFGLWRRGESPTGRLAVAAGLVVLAAGSLSSLGTRSHWPWEEWLWLGCAIGLLVLAVVTTWGLRVAPPSPSEAWVVVAACVLLVSLFLPWWGGFSGVPTGWQMGGAAGPLATVLVSVLLGWHRVIPEIGLAVAFYVTVTGFEAAEFGSLAWPSYLGFSAAGVVVLAIGVKQRKAALEWNALLTRIVPIAACLGFVAVPLADATTFRLQLDSPWRVSWLLLAGVVVDFRLLGRWLSSRLSDEFVTLPLALLALLGLDLIIIRDAGVPWQGWLLLGLCLLLLACGWIEQRGGLARLGITGEIWRVDRISAVED